MAFYFWVSPKVGVSVIVIKDGKVLMGKRKNAHGSGMWSFPGGHLEFNEEVEGCAMREMGWFEWGALPKPLFLPIENLLKQGFNPFIAYSRSY